MAERAELLEVIARWLQENNSRGAGRFPWDQLREPSKNKWRVDAASLLVTIDDYQRAHGRTRLAEE